MFRVSVIAASAASLFAVPAFAGSYAPAPAEPEIVAPVIVEATPNWTGGYVGASLGGGNLSGGGFDETKLVYGLQAGYDYDFGTYTLGGEAEYQARDMWKRNAADSTRLKARVGYDMGQTLVYGVVGGSMINSDWGYNVGFGGERMVADNVSVGAEYLFEKISDYDDDPNDLKGNTVAARVNYRF